MKRTRKDREPAALQPAVSTQPTLTDDFVTNFKAMLTADSLRLFSDLHARYQADTTRDDLLPLMQIASTQFPVGEFAIGALEKLAKCYPPESDGREKALLAALQCARQIPYPFVAPESCAIILKLAKPQSAMYLDAIDYVVKSMENAGDGTVPYNISVDSAIASDRRMFDQCQKDGYASFSLLEQMVRLALKCDRPDSVIYHLLEVATRASAEPAPEFGKLRRDALYQAINAAGQTGDPTKVCMTNLKIADYCDPDSIEQGSALAQAVLNARRMKDTHPSFEKMVADIHSADQPIAKKVASLRTLLVQRTSPLPSRAILVALAREIKAPTVL